MPGLPIEIMRQIVEDNVYGANHWIYHQQLLVLSLSCRLLRHEAQRVLFRNPALYTTSTHYNKTTMFLDTVLSSPDRLALYLRTLKITFGIWPHSNPGKFIDKLSRALRAMHNLKSLHFDDEFNRGVDLPSVLEGVHFKLTSFCWTVYPDAVSDGASVKTNFLQHQDEIVHLAISSFVGETTLQPIAAGICPRLRSLSAPYSITQFILPNKKYVTALQWIPSLDDGRTAPDNIDIGYSFHLDLISNELANLRYLSYGDSSNAFLRAPTLQHIVPYLKRLVYLQIDRGNIQVEALSRLPHLKTLVLIIGFNDEFPEQNEVMSVAIACKALERIDIQGDEGDFLSYQCDRSTEPIQVHTAYIDESREILWVNNFGMFDT